MFLSCLDKVFFLTWAVTHQTKKDRHTLQLSCKNPQSDIAQGVREHKKTQKFFINQKHAI